MNRLISNSKAAILIALFALLPFAAVHASAQNGTRVNIPFAFQANHAYLPAGHYRLFESASVVTFYNEDTGRAQAMLLARDELGHTVLDRGRLVFYVSGDRHLLTDVQFAGTSKEIVMLRQPKAERTVAGNANSTDMTIQIAMM
jgi:hypothetical protein